MFVMLWCAGGSLVGLYRGAIYPLHLINRTGPMNEVNENLASELNKALSQPQSGCRGSRLILLVLLACVLTCPMLGALGFLVYQAEKQIDEEFAHTPERDQQP